MAITRSPLVLKMGLGNDFIPQRVCATGTTVAPSDAFSSLPPLSIPYWCSSTPPNNTCALRFLSQGLV